MTDQHTPGPWTIGKFVDGRPNILTADGESQVAIICCPGHGPTGRNYATARLIAAAPDLLDACEKAEQFLDGDALPYDHPVREQIRKAMGKAHEYWDFGEDEDDD